MINASGKCQNVHYEGYGSHPWMMLSVLPTGTVQVLCQHLLTTYCSREVEIVTRCPQTKSSLRGKTESNKTQDALGSRLTCSTAWAGCQVTVPSVLEGAASQGRKEDELSPGSQEMTEFRQRAGGHRVGAENVCGSLRHTEFRNSHRQVPLPF